MPGMMDTVLNLGLEDEVAKNFREEINNQRIVYDYLHVLFLLCCEQYITAINCCQLLYTVYFKKIKKNGNLSVCYR